ncbi:MAG: flagellar biosynthesis protein FlgF, partial [Burkholderiaceae bacterium]|nr:flagellar biosynthesis protein FlgF [Burkholderiaceae bacterium]
DGFFDLPGTQAPPDATVRVAQGAFEGSNVNPTLAMVQMIDQSRLFDLNFRAVQTADQNARAAIGLVSLSRG